MPESNWELRTGADVAAALDWLRRRMQGRGLILVAIGTNSVAYAADPAITAFSAGELIKAQVGTIERGVMAMQKRKETRSASRREDLE